MKIDTVRKMGEWMPIRDCPGRFVLRGALPTLSIASLLGEGVQIQMFQSPRARDTIFVVCFDGGGTISYRRSDGSWLHTLGTQEGFRRKLEQLQITLSD
jgi:hypothetical protein